MACSSLKLLRPMQHTQNFQWCCGALGHTYCCSFFIRKRRRVMNVLHCMRCRRPCSCGVPVVAMQSMWIPRSGTIDMVWLFSAPWHHQTPTDGEKLMQAIRLLTYYYQTHTKKGSSSPKCCLAFSIFDLFFDIAGYRECDSNNSRYQLFFGQYEGRRGPVLQ